MTVTGADEIRMLRESAAAVCAAEFPMASVRRMAEEPTAICREGWEALVGQGWLGVLVPEAHGGLGLGIADLGVVLEELGKAAVPGPFWSAATLGVPAVALGDHDGLRAGWLDDLSTGARRVTLALQEDGALPGATGLGTVAEAAGSGNWTLSGTKRLVPDLAAADGVAVVARGPSGPLVFLVEASRAGVSIEPATLTDSTSRSGTLILDRVQVGEADLLGGSSLVERLLGYGNVGIAAMAVAGAQAVLEQAIAYVKQRTQFGVAIGTFQAVQHPLVNVFAEIESARSAYLYAAWAVDHQTEDARRAVALARLTSTAAYHHACITSLQAHGGIAFTWEYDLHFHLKRALHLRYLLGGPADYEEMIAREIL